MPVDQDMKDAIAKFGLHVDSDNLDKLLQLNAFIIIVKYCLQIYLIQRYI